MDKGVSEVSAPDTIQQGSDVGSSAFALTGDLLDPVSGMFCVNTHIVIVSGNRVVGLPFVERPAALTSSKNTEKIVNGKHGEYGFHDVAVQQNSEPRA
ncbi:MAG: hypothetical protein AB7T27_05230 [Kiritimatiellia bacterium]